MELQKKLSEKSFRVDQAGAEAEALITLNAISFLPLVARLTSHPVMITDSDGLTIWVNDAFTNLCGWKLEEIAGFRPMEFLHGPQTDLGVIAEVEQNVALRQPFQCELLNYRRDGTTFWIALDAQPILESDGTFKGYLSVQNDVSARKKFEADLLAEHQLLEAVGKCLTTYITSENPRVAFDSLLKHLLRLTGSEYGFIGEVHFDESNLPWLQTYAMSNIAWDKATRDLYEQYNSQGFEFRNLNTLFGVALTTAEPVIANDAPNDPRSGGLPEGHPALRRFLGLPILRDNRLLGLIGLANRSEHYSSDVVNFLEPLVVAIGQLIDACRRDAQRRQAEASLRETEEWLEETGRVAEIGAWQLDLRTKVLRWSAQTFRMHEVPPGYVPDVEKAVSFYAPEARRIIDEAVRRGISDGTPWDLELPFVTATGRHRWVQAVGHAAYEDGKIVRVYGTFKDITERRLAEEERHRLQSQFMQSQKMESVGRLAGGIAHDFNNMLAVILGHAEMLSLDETLLPKQKTHIKAIQSAGQRSADLTQQLLAFARRQNAAPQKIDVNRTITRLLDLLRRSMGENIDLQWVPGPDIWAISIDPVQLNQILANLCMNARDAIADTGRILLTTENETLTSPGQFRSSPLDPGEYVVLTISDTGSGMMESTLKYLFEPFNSTKPVGPGPGPGLGLATVYGIVRQNGGSIDVESDPEIGTTFRIYLPRVAESGRESSSSTDLSNLKKSAGVLLVEDEPALLKVGKLSLKQLGYRAYSATNAREALQMVQAHGQRIHVIITDIVLPGCNGWDLARQIHEMREGIRFVFMSGYGDSALPAGMALQHPFTVLSKPFNLQQLADAIHEAVALSSQAEV